MGGSTLYRNGWVVTMDDSAAEHPGGWLLVRDGSIEAVGAGDGPAADETVDLQRRCRDAGPRQHAPSPLPDPHARAGAGGDAVRVARRALPGLGADRRGVGVRGGADRARGAGAVRLLDGVRPPLRLSAREDRPRRGRGAGSAGDRRPHRRVARLHGPRRVAGRTAAGLARRGDRRRARRHGTARGAPGRRRLRPDRRRTLLAVLRDGPADGGVGGAGAEARPRAAHAPGRDARRGGVLPASCTAAAPSSTSTRSAGSTATSGARTACTCPSATSCGSARPTPVSRTAPPRTSASARASRRCASCSTQASGSASASTAPRRTSAATCSSR